MRNQRGNAFVEYFVLAAIILLATMAFFRNEIADGGGANSAINSAFDDLCRRIARRPCQ